MKKADKEFFNSYPSVDTVLKVGKDYFLPANAVKAKILSKKHKLDIEILHREVLTNKKINKYVNKNKI